jgi:L-rhamnose-H+ transport protein
LKEWRGVSLRTKAMVFLTLLTLVGSTMIVGYGNYLGLRPNPDAARSLSAPNSLAKLLNRHH